MVLYLARNVEIFQVYCLQSVAFFRKMCFLPQWAIVYSLKWKMLILLCSSIISFIICQYTVKPVTQTAKRQTKMSVFKHTPQIWCHLNCSSKLVYLSLCSIVPQVYYGYSRKMEQLKIPCTRSRVYKIFPLWTSFLCPLELKTLC